ncbi:MAG TPA: hypothetical protein VGN70_03950 [Gammaproteobacteria bacterium]|jgi:hypothetical protein
MITKEALRKQLDSLHQEGSDLVDPDSEEFELMYQCWYTRALPLMK